MNAERRGGAACPPAGLQPAGAGGQVAHGRGAGTMPVAVRARRGMLAGRPGEAGSAPPGRHRTLWTQGTGIE
ncbi:MAG: hypothetical protein ACOC91_03705 [bacterium]